MKQVVSLLIATVMLASCGGEKKENSAEKLAKLKKERAALDQKIAGLETEVNKNAPKPATPVTVLDLQRTSFVAAIDVTATITGDQNVLASPQMGGKVTRILVKPGQAVRQGQTLATLDADAVQQQIAAQDAQVVLTRELYNKQQRLWAQQIGTEVQLLQAKANYIAASKQKAGLEAQRDMYNIVAPVSGTIDPFDLKVGDMAQPGQTGIRVVNLSKLKAQADLGENYLGKVKQGDPVTLVFSEMNDSMRTKLSNVAKVIDPGSRTFLVEVLLGSNPKLRPNMSCRMKIANYQASNALAVPVSVVQNTAAGDMIYTVQNGKAKAVKVTTGQTYNGLVEITSGLNEGDKIITEGYQDLDEGEAVSFQ